MSGHDASGTEVLVSRLRRALETGEALTIDRAEAGALLQELPRLLQSTRRLRSQNAKLRRRIERLKQGLPDSSEAADAAGEDVD